MMVQMISFALCIALASSVAAPTPVTFSTIEPSLTAIREAAATAPVGKLTSNVKGAAFNRFIQIWLENTDYTKAAADPNLQALAKQGITLTNYWASTHPSLRDNFERVPANVSTVIDLLDTKNISWAEYQEDLPYAGFQGFNYSNQQTFASD
ncbi:hypothetical protein V1527DRAFT_501335 [Lipomyces starkeyi]